MPAHSFNFACLVGAFTAAVLSTPLTFAAASDTAADTAQAPPAVWTEKSLHFVFSGFTTHYSCEGLRAKLRHALLQLGARKDLQVTEGACSSASGGPEPFPNVDINAHILQPALADTHRARVPAHWKRIDLTLDKDPLWQAEDCELLEQIKQRVIPLITARNIDYHSACIAHQVTPGGTWFRADVLLPDHANAQNPPSP